MKIVITFTDDNAAFTDNGIPEYGYIMDQAIGRVYAEHLGTFPLTDSNGNTVGEVTLKK